MPKVLSPDEIDPIAEELDQQLQDSGEVEAPSIHKFDPNANYPDLSDGGVVNGVQVRPMPESGRVTFGKKVEPGRPVGRQVWMWNGRPSIIPLSWDTEGKHHDGGRRYLLKRHCTVCKFSGFYGRECPVCRKAGRPAGKIVPAFYLRKEQTPEHIHAFGGVDCFIPQCVRRGEYGFASKTEMRQHAMTKHRREYRAFMDEQGSSEREELVSLRNQLNEMQAALLRWQGGSTVPVPAPRPGRTPEQKALRNEQLRKARAARRAKVAQTA